MGYEGGESLTFSDKLPGWLVYPEPVESYRRGKPHPVKIEDIFQADRYQYKIIRKLGHGSFSTVWLAECTNDPRYVAIKILSSDASSTSKEVQINRIIRANATARGHIVTLLDSFKHDGPNGEHECLVFEPMGPAVAACYDPDYNPILAWQAKSICKQLLTALKCLHDLGIAHSDSNPGNLLLSLTIRIQQPSSGGKCWSTGVKGNSQIPGRIYENRPLTEFWDREVPVELKLSDLGAAFFSNDPPATPVIANGLRAPEVVLQSSFDHRIDIWSFGCLLFELFTRAPLFVMPPFNLARTNTDHLHGKEGDGHSLPGADGNDQALQENNDDNLLQMIHALGPLPPAMFERWPRGKRYFNKDGEQIRSDVGKSEIPSDILVGHTLEQRFQERKPKNMTYNESAGLLAVIRSALKYDPQDRLSAAELLALPWFNQEYIE
ncbi:kinase-like domain-containing protein [Ampelomyces quisqualis]|uniref:non-specific serine/threonine protein kinase n=1 Tax=Ampelomyces quisqualis TaxID=50730 RepID=A0A6A5QFS3_AMPQU|nr:kinase-like domain-containing protein [Ampelomyces quisqualis]